VVWHHYNRYYQYVRDEEREREKDWAGGGQGCQIYLFKVPKRKENVPNSL
jgi:hypothetical protein